MSRRPKQSPGKVSLWYGRIDREPADVCAQWMPPANKRHCNLVLQIFSSKNLRMAFDAEDKKRSGGLPTFYDLSWIEELDKAGFDLSTLKFSIEMKKSEGEDAGQSTTR